MRSGALSVETFDIYLNHDVTQETKAIVVPFVVSTLSDDE
jgi:hypothetical protein